MKKFSLFILALLCLCANAWALDLSRYSSSPTLGGPFYIYNVGQKFFLKESKNSFDYTTPSTTWTISSSDGKYLVKGSGGHTLYLKKDGTSRTVEIDNSSNTTEFSSSSNGAYKFKGSDNYNLVWDNKELKSQQNNNTTYSDWIFMTSTQYEDYLADLQAEVIQASATYLPSTSGWNRITTLPTNLDDYYYCFVANSTPLMVKMATGSSNQQNELTLYYDDPVDPMVNKDYLWTITSHATSGYQAFRNVENASWYVQTRDNGDGAGEWNIQSRWETTPNRIWTKFLFEYDNTNHWWTIKNARFDSDFYLGLWYTDNGNGYVADAEFAGNKDINNAGRFQIYAIKKTDLTDYNDRISTGKSGWTSDQGNLGEYSSGVETYNKPNNVNTPFSVGKIIHQTATGLTPGLYLVEFYATINMAWIETNYGNGYARVYAESGSNRTTQDIVTNKRKNCTITDYLHGLIVEVGESGTLEFGVECTQANGGEWCVVQAKSLKKLQTSDDISSVIANNTIKQLHIRKESDGWLDTIPNGWTATTHVAGNHNYTKASASSHDACVDTYFECWNGDAASFDVDYNQTISLPAGTYRLQADLFFNSDQNALALYINQGNGDYYTESSLVKTNSSDNAGPNTTYTLEFTLSEAKAVKLGVKKVAENTSGKWMGADNFKLYYIGAPNKTKTLTSSYGMLYNQKYDILIDNATTNAYYATYDSENNVVTLTEVLAGAANKVIPAGSVVLLHNTNNESSILYRYVAEVSAVNIPAGNCFYHHDNATDVNYVNYVLGVQDGVVAFHKFTGNEAQLDGYNVLRLPASSLGGKANAPSIIRIVMEENTATALVPVYEENPATAATKANGVKQLINGHLYILQGDAIYDMLGRKIR